MASVPSSGSGSRTRLMGSNSIPTEMKNSTAKASRKGRDSSAARWLSSDSLITIPAKNAPNAKETPNRWAAPKATPSAMASTPRRNNSREPVWATTLRSHGMTLRPTMSISATKTMTLAMVRRMMPPMPRPSHETMGSLAAVPSARPVTLAMAGSNTRAMTMARSSTISQPTAMRPRSVSIRRRSCMARSRTTVLAVERARPKTRPA